MRRFWPYLIFGLAAAAASFFGVILATPYLMMSIALGRLSGDGAHINHFVFAPQTTSASRAVVRPSPDLVYSACVFDLSHGPLRVRAARWDGYMSISVFAANSDNVFALNDRQSPDGVDFVLALPGQPTPTGMRTVLSPTRRGIILDRRLAPDAESFARADLARRADECAPLKDERR